jgi:hypothetical protein
MRQMARDLFHRVARTGDDSEARRVEDRRVISPGPDLGEGIGADDEKQF